MMSAVLAVLLEAALRALAAAIVVGAALVLLRVRNVPAQKMAWTLTLAGAVAMPLLMRFQWLPAADALQVPDLSRFSVPAPSWLLTLALPASPQISGSPAASEGAPIPPPFAWSAPSPQAARGAEENVEFDRQDSLPAIPDSTNFAPLQHESDPIPPAGAASAPAAHPLRPVDFVWLLYLAGAVALLLRLATGLFSVLRLWLTADPVPAPALAGLAPSGSVRSSPRLSSPANFGSGIVLPAGYTHWSEEKMRVVLAHERAHVRQGDFYLQLLAGFYAALTWFSPLGWWLKRKLSELGEAVGDRAGMEAAASPSSYARMLLEFAALPRPTYTGVAMARTSRLASRIDRLLNDAAFHQSFTGSRRRALLALLIAPLALLASAALVRVEAAGQTAAPAQLSAHAPTSATSPDAGVSAPPQSTSSDSQQQPAPAPAPAPPASPAAEPSPAPAPDAAPAPPAPPVPGQEAVPPSPPAGVQVAPIPPMSQVVPLPPMPDVDADVNKAMAAEMKADADADAATMRVEAVGKNAEWLQDSRYFFFAGGEPWALVPAQGEPYPAHLSSADRAEIDSARKTARAPFFWFRHEGKSYVIDDPAIVAQIQSLEKPTEDLRSQMRALSKQQRDLSQQLRQKMREQRQTSIPKPDLSKQMADLNAAVDSLKSIQGNTITRDEFRNLQQRIAALQGQLFAAQSGLYKQNGEWGAAMGEFGKQMGQLGAEQGRLAGEMAHASMQNRGKIDAIIKQSLSDGKAKPAQ